MKQENPRRKRVRAEKIVDRRLQLRFAAWSAGTTLLALGLQYVLTVNTLADVALQPHADVAAAYDAAITGALRNLAISVLIGLPLATVVHVLTSFKVLGPLVAVRRFLTEVRDQRRPSDLRLRKGDELQDLCELLNDATRPLREDGDANEEPQERDAA